jgi:aminoglycoside phosphotransferase (APT) family kinase protein
MKITVNGNSGCSLSVTYAQGRLCVIKTAKHADYCRRLKAQINKQKQAAAHCPYDFIHIPQILAEHEQGSGAKASYSATMEYLNYQDYADYFATASRPALDSFITKLITLLEHQLENSSSEQIEAERFIHKLDEISNKVVGSANAELKLAQLAELKQAVSAQPIRLPIGPTHGDLTLANMMVSADGSRIGIFDFLDSYLDSPLIDIAKVRQDTQFFWSQLMTEESLDYPRYRMVMAYIDGKINSHFSKYDWYQRYYGLIQGINIARIFPYEKHPRVTDFTTRTLSLLGY